MKEKLSDPELRERNRIKAREWYRSNPDRAWAGNLRKYHITPEDYYSILESQNGTCALCDKTEILLKSGKTLRLAVDHDHNCCNGPFSCGRCVRGLLCARHNMAVGFIEDPTLIDKVKSYLTRSGETTEFE